MKGSSQVILGATLILAASLAIVLGLVAVLLAELYCSLLRRRRRCRRLTHHHNQPPVSSSAAALSPTPSSVLVDPSTPSPLSSFYAHGVLHAPRSLLFPSLPSPMKKNHHRRHEPDPDPTHHRIGLIDSVSAPSPLNFISLGLPHQGQEEEEEDQSTSSFETLVYISNPIYDDDGANQGRLPNTPFETPDSSPSCLEGGDDEALTWREREGDDERSTPPLNPMKKLPEQACSVPLRVAACRSLCTLASDSTTNRGLLSSSSSGTPCTSPSW